MAIYILPGDPISNLRPRNLGQHYWDSLKKLKHDAINQLETQSSGIKPIEKPVHLELHFYITPNRNQHMSYHATRPDIVDLIKYIESVVSPILLRDSKIIASISSFKKYSEMPRTEIIITELEELNDKKK